MFELISDFVIGLFATCNHKNVGWPQGNKQRCLDCGAFRFYRIGKGPLSRWTYDRFVAKEAA
jgi:hypothetical protein